MSGCLNVKITRVEGGMTPPSIVLVVPLINANVHRTEDHIKNIEVKGLNDFSSFSVTRKTAPLTVNISALCSVGVFERDHELFYVKEGVFLLVDGKKLKVLKYEL